MEQLSKYIIFLTLYLLVAYAQDYCSICCDHTMCTYEGVSESCGVPMKLGLNETEIHIIVSKHNELRNKVALGQEQSGNPGPQPRASNMLKLKWDSELSTVAQRWVEQCTVQSDGMIGHDACRNSERFNVGQNTITFTSTEMYTNIDIEVVATQIYSEVSNFNPINIEPFHFEPDSERYTQLVWADTYLVGCGIIFYYHGEGLYKYSAACNYGPAGNVSNGSMYIVGTPTSNCPERTTQDVYYLGLCS